VHKTEFHKKPSVTYFLHQPETGFVFHIEEFDSYEDSQLRFCELSNMINVKELQLWLANGFALHPQNSI
jgi:hypothetical protein